MQGRREQSNHNFAAGRRTSKCHWSIETRRNSFTGDMRPVGGLGLEIQRPEGEFAAQAGVVPTLVGALF